MPELKVGDKVVITQTYWRGCAGVVYSLDTGYIFGRTLIGVAVNDPKGVLYLEFIKSQLCLAWNGIDRFGATIEALSSSGV